MSLLYSLESELNKALGAQGVFAVTDVIPSGLHTRHPTLMSLLMALFSVTSQFCTSVGNTGAYCWPGTARTLCKCAYGLNKR